LAKGSWTSADRATDGRARGYCGSRWARSSRTQLSEVGTAAKATTTVQHPSGQVQWVAFGDGAGVGELGAVGAVGAVGAARSADMSWDIPGAMS